MPDDSVDRDNDNKKWDLGHWPIEHPEWFINGLLLDRARSMFRVATPDVRNEHLARAWVEFQKEPLYRYMPKELRDEVNRRVRLGTSGPLE